MINQNIKDKILPTKKANIRIHGNGFLQAETACGNKFHIWDTRLPRQKVPTLIHNHNHGFTSTILIGELMWKEFKIIATSGIQQQSNVYVPHKCIPRNQKDTELKPCGEIVALSPPRHFVLTQGSTYEWPLNINMFHEVKPAWYFNKQCVITFVERGQYDNLTTPTVLVPCGVQPDNDFDRYGFNDIAAYIYEEAVEIISTITRTQSN